MGGILKKVMRIYEEEGAEAAQAYIDSLSPNEKAELALSIMSGEGDFRLYEVEIEEVENFGDNFGVGFSTN